MLLSAVSALVVAQLSSEIPEGLMNNPVLRGTVLQTSKEIRAFQIEKFYCHARKYVQSYCVRQAAYSFIQNAILFRSQTVTWLGRPKADGCVKKPGLYMEVNKVCHWHGFFSE